jgi:hypothetical protein
MRTRTKHGQNADVAEDIELFWSVNLPKYQRVKKVPPGRLELPAQGLGIPCSIRLSYGGTLRIQWLRWKRHLRDGAGVYIGV